ncbi:2812_t:CDS:2 [Cetraspora pellucida]|uniref:2812_t:CDS:1 n=1 Tax=Cetraspora pellucida TaxID=1433469 RepID=A0A9N9APH4_9GLOM|nr:2812_t:CDS:2 [Cetraspora pellucida]
MSNSIIQQTSCEADDFVPSELGTKEYWESRYDLENKNFKDIGDIAILDVGCGNGYLLIKLASHNFTNLFGIDYSSNAIKLANEIARSRRFDNVISYRVADLLHEDVLHIINGSDNVQKFDFILDKGTFDAISLSLQRTSSNQLLRDTYPTKILSLLNPNGYFLITSCNFTKDELIENFNGGM